MSWDVTRVHTNSMTTNALIPEEKLKHFFQEHEDNVEYSSLDVRTDI